MVTGPITDDELVRGTKTTKLSTAPGPDGRGVSEIKALGTLKLERTEREKKWLVDAATTFIAGGILIRALKPGETYKYLGLEIGVAEQRRALAALIKDLGALKKGPLKPQQKLWAMKNVIVPKHQYPRVQGKTSQAGVQKPDLVVWDRLRSMVLDVQIVADSSADILDQTHGLKLSYYDKESIRAYVQARTGHEHAPVVSTLTINWWGYMASQSHETLKTLGLNKGEVRRLTFRSLKGSVAAFREHWDIWGLAHLYSAEPWTLEMTASTSPFLNSLCGSLVSFVCM
ncbi:Retrovirus-related Pol polyprotein from type-1 retrotransposable element R2 [Portunus trituberculatus]|uniref:Retrovirus-related Pol polyprotein from type-1 retrotransposable element R2 n=1 Tax=Portunus trituberculatus TaxID=210409 RepID=A0A5B7GDR1_PORTR|nr:Retrovirus-related Pol polyprotein from type-1 retrotransposable element R2 [Portunus trituberculatus]